MMEKPTQSKNGAIGFTLVELLVCIGVIGVLLVLLNTALVGLRQSSTQAADANQLRQLWVASAQLSSEHRNLVLVGADKNNRFGFGPSTEWFKLLRPYLGYSMTGKETVRLYVSPGDPSKGGEKKLGPTRAFKFRSYGVNSRTEYRSSVKGENGSVIHGASDPLNRLNISKPSQLVLMGNLNVGVIGDSSGINSLSEPFKNGIAIPSDWFANQRANFVFLDGHVESIRVEDVLEGGPRFNLFDRTLPVE